MINKRLLNLKKKFKANGIDGYVIPKNDEFFSEYTNKDRLRTISDFTGSAGYAVILNKKNYLFVDGRYHIQAQIESGKNFEIVDLSNLINCKLFSNLTIGIDPKLFTSQQVKKFFHNNKIKLIDKNLIDEISSKYKLTKKSFFSITDVVAGESFKKKIKKISNILKKKNVNFLFVSAPENVAWVLNIRGFDSPYSPIPNCRLILDDKNKFYLIVEKTKVSNLLKDNKIKSYQIIDPNKFSFFLNKLKKGKMIIDNKTCSIFNINLIKKNFRIKNNDDPIYLLKSIKNSSEIKNMIDCHIHDGVALTKFLYWIKKINKKKLTEFSAQKKLEFFRKKNKYYISPSFNTIAGSGKNGAIIHYRATKKNTKIIRKDDIFLCDSGGQYEFGTTDVTRTICFSKPKKNIKDVFTKVLKGHIAVIKSNLETHFNGKLIDQNARKFLRKSGLDYHHGTGHGVGYFLNVHEGPQAISKFNTVRIKKGMILSNEPGYYKKGHFGIRIENLMYVRKKNKKLFFENLTLAPIEKDLINFDLLTKAEKEYLFQYHMDVYSKLSKYLNQNEKKWLASFI